MLQNLLTEIEEARPSKYNKAYDYQIQIQSLVPYILAYDGTYVFIHSKADTVFKTLETVCGILIECVRGNPNATPWDAMRPYCDKVYAQRQRMYNGGKSNGIDDKISIYRLHRYLTDFTINDVNVSNLDMVIDRARAIVNECKMLRELIVFSKKHGLVTIAQASGKMSTLKINFKEDKKQIMLGGINHVLLAHASDTLLDTVKLYKAKPYGVKGTVYVKNPSNNELRVFVNASRRWTLTDIDTIASLKDMCPGAKMCGALNYLVAHKQPNWVRSTHYIDVQSEQDFNILLIMCGDLLLKKRNIDKLL